MRAERPTRPRRCGGRATTPNFRWWLRADGDRFEVESSYLARFDVQRVGSNTSLEYWIPAEELDEFNDHIVGTIQVVASYGPQDSTR